MTWNITQKSPSAHHRTTLSGYIFATKAYIDNWKKSLHCNISSTCPHNMVNFGPVAAEIGWRVSGTPANFNGFRVLASINTGLLYSTDVNQTLHDVRPCPGLVHHIYIGEGLSTPNGILSGTKFTASKSCILLYWQRYCTALKQCTSAKLRRGTRNGITELSPLVIFNKGRHLYSEGGITLGISPHSSFRYFHLSCQA